MDNKKHTGKPDRDRININENYELQDWSKKFGITHQQLTDAVGEAGTSAKEVEKYLKGKKK